MTLWLLLSFPLFGQALPGTPTGQEPYEGKCWKITSGRGQWGDCGGAGSAIPAGSVLLIVNGTCPSGFSEEASLNGKTLLGTLAANGDVGSTGGSDAVTPSGTIQQAVFTGTQAATSADTAGTPSGTVEQASFTGNPLATHAHGVGTYATSAHTGTTVADHASHTHDYSQIINHTHTISITDPGHTHTQSVNSASTGPLSGYTADTSTNTSTASGYSTASNTTGITASSNNPGGGVATGTTVGPSATLTHSVTQPANHTLSGSSEAVSAGTPSGSINSQSFTGNALAGHSHTLTPSGSINSQSFAGTQFDNRSAFVRVIFCRKD